ncbi:FAD-dependent monooxygenase [Fodinicola feengrottensis]|nr:FAD-dependent monooxygenase [Fodinicola feengrottensis]
MTVFVADTHVLPIVRAAGAVLGSTLHHVVGPVSRHQDGRTVLVGDAAHPVGAGQGASMAIEDAVVLAQQLRKADSVAAGLRAYDHLRRTRTEKMVRMAAANTDAKIAGPLAARMRNLFMPLFFARAYPKATAWLYAYDPGTLPVTVR